MSLAAWARAGRRVQAQHEAGHQAEGNGANGERGHL
jgi:hypothetical protein